MSPCPAGKYPLDLVRRNDGRYFAIMGGMGMDAQMIADADREAKNKMGQMAYFWAALKNLPRRRAYVDIFLDDQPRRRRRVKSVLLANMGKITGGLDAIPTASPHDGLLDVGILKSATLAQGLRLLGYALLGRSQDDPDLEVYQARKVRIHARVPEPVQFDGEDCGQMQEFSVEIVPQAVQILLPEDAPAARDADEPPAVVAQKTARRRLLPPLALAASACRPRLAVAAAEVEQLPTAAMSVSARYPMTAGPPLKSPARPGWLWVNRSLPRATSYPDNAAGIPGRFGRARQGPAG